MSKNQDIAELFNRAADVMALLEENSFRVLGTRKVARIIEDLPEDIKTLQEQGRLEQMPGIGKGTVDKVSEYLRTGHISEFEELFQENFHGTVQSTHVQKTHWPRRDADCSFGGRSTCNRTGRSARSPRGDV